ncbi:SET domain-containing protein [Variovorax sp. LjRoot290]|uniref:SET domain-containing protein-lysine N-methyltransferase n=1 Tax=unclassified Variovorax TaxID=663243 RepID=UPI003ED0ACE5
MNFRDIDLFADRMLGGAPFIETIAGAELASSTIQGRGMFARRAWATGELLCVLDGQVVDVTRHPAVIDALEWNALSPQRLLVRALRTSYGFINHSGRPNTRIDADGRTMRACRPIAPGDELTMDYFEQPVPPVYLASLEAAVLKKNS